MAANDPLQEFHWREQPQAAALIRQLITTGIGECPASAQLATALGQNSGTRLGDCLERIELGSDEDLLRRLCSVGFVLRPNAAADIQNLHHPHGLFPEVVLRPDREKLRLVIAVDSLAAFLPHQAGAILPKDSNILSQRAFVAGGACAELWVSDIPYHGTADAPDHIIARRATVHLDALRLRQRDLADQDAAFASIERLLAQAIRDCGVDQACAVFFAAEREFWQQRNHAAQLQRSRQDTLGLGWANHDHHTYRSSRGCFTRMIALFEQLGFSCRERFYPGGDAGWGAQVLEHPRTGVVIFADVDMSSHELREDFAHLPFQGAAQQRPLGTVGLWCALHGESLFSAGMHHLACRVDFDLVRTQLEAQQVPSMKPFSWYPHLRQCFTVGETWTVPESRLLDLERIGQISAAQAAGFRRGGALGSHLELIERNAGFKGFNQHGVDEIIAGTDPRRQSD